VRAAHKSFVAFVLAATLLLAGCKEEKATAISPQEPTGASVAAFCGMAVLDHPGPKGQIFLKGQGKPLWFGSARDTIAFMLLPEEPKDIAAAYVNDMGKASWDKPEPGAWVEARKAWYVIGSRRESGMGTAEAVPFAEKTAAERFVARYGGRIAAFAEIPDDYILGEGAGNPSRGPSPGGQGEPS